MIKLTCSVTCLKTQILLLLLFMMGFVLFWFFGTEIPTQNFALAGQVLCH